MKRILTAMALLTLVLVVAATSFAAEPPGDARVRVAHLSPDAPNVDVWVDGNYAFTDVAFEDITDYATLPAGDYLVQVEPAGAGGGGPFVISATLTLAADTEYTVAATDELANITPVVLIDDNTIPAPGQSHVRFVHGSPDAPAVDITLTDGTVLFGNVAFGEASSYLPVAAGSYDLQVRVAGTNTVVLELMGVPFGAETVYTVFATGFATGGTPALNAVLNEDAGIARVRVAHMSPDAPAVDVRVNGAVALANIPFEAVTGYVELPSNAYFIEVVPAGQPGPVVIAATLELAPNTDYTVAAVNDLANIEPLVLVDDNTIPGPGQSHVRFVHASPDAPAVDITLTDGTVLFGNIAFKEVGNYLPVAAGTYDLEVRLAGTSTVVLSLPGIPFSDQTVYTVFATGFAAGGPPPLNAALIEDAGLARVRVAHLSPDAPNVDVLVDGVVAFANAPFEGITDYAALPSGAYYVEVVPAGQPGPAVIAATLELAPNTDYTVAAVNDLANIEPLVLVDDNTIPAAGNAHIRFLHASPDAPAVDITLTDGTILFGNVAFKEVGTYLPVPFGFYDVEVRLAGTSTVVLSLSQLPFKDQHVYTVYATGFAGGGQPGLNAILSLDARGDDAPTDVSLSTLTGTAGSGSTLWVTALAGLLVLGLAGGLARKRR